MSGIAGFWGSPNQKLLQSMTDALRHRGPDGEGFFACPEVSLGHRRLSAAGEREVNMPLASEDGRLQLVLDGEIYNAEELRAELTGLGHAFTTSSDAEVILRAYQAFGTDSFGRLNGVWAIGIADLDQGLLILCRDHLGVKPLYYTSADGQLLFASEIRPLLQAPGLERLPNDQVIYDYLAFGLLDHRSETFFAGVSRLPAATYAVVSAEGVALHRYWEPQPRRDAPRRSEPLNDLLRAAVARRVTSEGPVGACLAGTPSAATMAAAVAATGPLHTFAAISEGDPAAVQGRVSAAAAAIGGENSVVKPTSAGLVEELVDLILHQEEPMDSPAPYVGWEIMRTAHEQVVAVLSPIGSDELLADRSDYRLVHMRELARTGKYGAWLREAWTDRRVVWPLFRQERRNRARRAATERLLRKDFVAGVTGSVLAPSADNLNERLRQDVLTYRLPALLRYQDRNAAAFSIAARAPFLDPQVVECALGRAEAATGSASSATGFSAPELRWIKARRAVLQGIVNSPAFQSRKYWDGPAVAADFAATLSGRAEWTLFFWRAINVELWLRVFFDGTATAGVMHSFTELGDVVAAELAGSAAAAELLADARPNPGKGLFMSVAGQTYARVPVRTRLVSAGDDLLAVANEALAGRERPGDIIAISEKIVAISQGRSFPISNIKPSAAARLLSRFVRRTPSGIGLGIPETMQLAIGEVGLPRILVACVVSALTRVFGLRGLFYRIVGPQAAAIDGPTPGTIPPYNTHAKLAPKDPDQVAQRLSAALGHDIGVAIIDANDLGVNVLGQSSGVDARLVARLFVDNPLGQGAQQTPIALLRRVSE